VVDELEQGMQVEPAVCGQPLRGLDGESSFEQAAQSPAPDVERGSIVDAAAAEVWEVVDGHALLVSLGMGGLTSSTAPGKNWSRRDTNMAVTRSTTSRSGAPGRTAAHGAASWVVALGASVCAASAGVHAALVLPHSHESAILAVAFAVSAVALTVAAVALALKAGPTVTTVVAFVLVGVAAAYALSRTTGIPGLTAHPEPLDAFGTVVSCLELTAAWALVRPPTRRSRS
jgi:hypothetical protein